MIWVRFNQGQWGYQDGETLVETSGLGGSETGRRYPVSQVQLRYPANPSKIVCVGRNYLDHIRELGNDTGQLPAEPGLFLKGPNTLADPGEVVPYPSFSQSFHFEGELALIVGRRMSRVSQQDALEHVFGYTCGLDLTARDRQKTDLQWVRAKAADKFLPLGPWIQTELDPLNAQVQTRVNGELRQNASTQLMIFPVDFLLSYISQYLTLEPGDLVLTGTPEGVGPLQPGDVVEVSIDGIGALTTPIGAVQP